MKFRLTDGTLGIIAVQLLFLLFAACAQQNQTTQNEASKHVFSEQAEPPAVVLTGAPVEPQAETSVQSELLKVAAVAPSQKPTVAPSRKHRVKRRPAPVAAAQVYGQIYRVPKLDE